MQQRLLAWLRKVWNDFRSFSPGQKAVTIVAVVGLIVGGILFAAWKSTPTYAPLFSNLSATDAAAVVDKLSSSGVPYQIAGDGTQILVPQDKVYATRLAMSSDGLPGSDSSGYSLLDKEGITTSEFKQQVDYQRAIEGELAKTIDSLDGVQQASVHLAIPQQDVFNDGSTQPTAAVMLTLSPGATITTAQVQSVVYLVSSSVPGLDPSEVTVADSAGHVLAAPGDELGSLAGGDARSQMTQDYNTRLSNALQAMLDKTVGAGHSVVTVNSELDFDRTSTTKQSYTYDPDTPPVWSQESSENSSGNQGGGGTFGTGTAAESAPPTGQASSYGKTDKTVSNALGTVTQTVQNTPGAVKKLAIAVLLDKDAPGVDLKAISSLVTSAVGLDKQRGDTLAIQAMPFDDSAAKAAAAAEAASAKSAAATAAHDRLMSLIKQGAIGLLVLVVLAGTWWASVRRRRAEPVAVEDQSLELELLTHRPAEEPAPESVPLDGMHEAIARRRALVALADEQPDDVARVLSGWLGSRETVREGAML